MTSNVPDPQAFHDFEQAGWERAASSYGDAFGSVTSQTIERMLAAVHAGPGVRLLDLATGPGYVAAAAAAAGASAVGVDFSAAMIALATRIHPHVVFREGDAEALTFPDASFDAVTMNFGLLHLARPDAALAEMRRVLAPAGRLAFTVWAPPASSAGFAIVLRAVEQHGRVDIDLPPGPPFFRFSDTDECLHALSAAGLIDARVDVLPLIWRVPSPDALYDMFVHGAVRTAALLRAQTPQATAAIRQAIREDASAYRRGDAIELPMAAVLASARRAP